MPLMPVLAGVRRMQPALSPSSSSHFFLVCVFPLCLCCVAGAKRLHAHIYKGVIISLSSIAFTITIMTSSSVYCNVSLMGRYNLRGHSTYS